MKKFVWRIIVCSLYEGDDDSPRSLDFETFEEADNVYNSYHSELTIHGSHAYSCIPPFSVEVVNL